MWKWEQITTDFITKPPRTDKGFDAIWVMCRLPDQECPFPYYLGEIFGREISDVYVREIATRHGVTIYIVSNRDVRFTTMF